jgi:hypothetical protein
MRIRARVEGGERVRVVASKQGRNGLWRRELAALAGVKKGRAEAPPDTAGPQSLPAGH